jgi:hypothetical protein
MSLTRIFLLRSTTATLVDADETFTKKPRAEGANNLARANKVGDYPKVWANHCFMLDEIAKIIPDISAPRDDASGASRGIGAKSQSSPLTASRPKRVP